MDKKGQRGNSLARKGFMPEVIYQSDGHKYFVDGRQYPGITRVLSDLGWYGQGKQFFTEHSRSVGTAVHQACPAIDKFAPQATTWDQCAGIFASFPAALVPFVEGYLLFKRETGYDPAFWEKPLASSELRLAGTPDSYGDFGAGKAVLDLKCWKNQGAKPKKSAELQLAGYATMLKERAASFGGGSADIQRLVLKLPGNGKYRLYECTDRCDFQIVRECGHVWWCQHQAGIVKMQGDPEPTEEETNGEG